MNNSYFQYLLSEFRGKQVKILIKGPDNDFIIGKPVYTSIGYMIQTEDKGLLDVDHKKVKDVILD